MSHHNEANLSRDLRDAWRVIKFSVILSHQNECLNKIFILAISARVLSYRVVETSANTFQLTKVSIHFDSHQICNVNVSFFLF